MKAKLKKPLTITLFLMLAIGALDLIAGHFNSSLGFSWKRPGLSGAAAYNSLIEEIWTTETYALILLPVFLFALSKKLTRSVFVSLCVAIALADSVALSFYRVVEQSRTYHVPRDYVLRIHKGSGFYADYFDRTDSMLESVWPYLLRAQVPVAAIACLAYLASTKIIKLDRD